MYKITKILIHSHKTYVIQAWGNGNTNKLDILQKRALKIINKKKDIGVIRTPYLSLQKY